MMMQDLELGLKISVNLLFTMLENVLMMMGEVDIGLSPAVISPIIQVMLVYHWVFIVMVMAEVDICPIPANFIHINMVDYTLPTPGFLKSIFQEARKEKSTPKLSLLFLSKNFTTPSSKNYTTSLSQHAISSFYNNLTTTNLFFPY